VVLDHFNSGSPYCASEAAACLADATCVSLLTDMAGSIPAVETMQELNDLGANVDAAADDSGCCAHELCSAYCTRAPCSGARVHASRLALVPTKPSVYTAPGCD
jgi:hypothetical protein